MEYLVNSNSWFDFLCEQTHGSAPPPGTPLKRSQEHRLHFPLLMVPLSTESEAEATPFTRTSISGERQRAAS